MSVQTQALFCIFIAILLPDWLSSAELRPSAKQLAPPYIPLPEDYPYIEDMSPPLVEEERTRPSRRKRLMGIFRCNGWGPGCTQLEGGNEGGAGGGGRGHGHDRHYHGGEAASNRSPIEKFQPFFTLTSGGSWGPTGKRSGTRGGRRQMTPPRHTESDSQNDLTSASLGDMTSTSQLLHHLVARDRKFLRDRDQSRETLLLDALRRLADEGRLLKHR